MGPKFEQQLEQQLVGALRELVGLGGLGHLQDIRFGAFGTTKRRVLGGHDAQAATSRSRASAGPSPLLLMSRRARLIVVRNSQPTAFSFLADASDRVNKPMAAPSSRPGSRQSSDPWIR